MKSIAKKQSVICNLPQLKSHFARQLVRADLRLGNCHDSKSADRPKPLTFPVWQWLVILILAFSLQDASAQTTWSMAYDVPNDNGYQNTSTLDWAALTHIAFAGGAPQLDGSVTLSTNFSTIAPGVISAAHSHNTKVLFSLTNLEGFPVAGTDFTDAISNHESQFIANIMSVVNTYGFDGVDSDDEEAWNGTLMTTFFTDLRAALGSKLLTSTTWDQGWTQWTSTLAAKLDRLELMTYDLAWTGDPETWFNAALYNGNFPLQSVNLMVSRFEALGIPAGNLSIGLPFCGKLWTPNTGPYQPYAASPAATQTYLLYSNIHANYDLTKAALDPLARVPWLNVSSNSWLTYENEQSLTEKVNYVKTQNLGGWFIWNLTADFISGSSPTNPLLEAVKKASISPAPPTGVQVIKAN